MARIRLLSIARLLWLNKFYIFLVSSIGLLTFRVLDPVLVVEGLIAWRWWSLIVICWSTSWPVLRLLLLALIPIEIVVVILCRLHRVVRRHRSLVRIGYLDWTVSERG